MLMITFHCRIFAEFCFTEDGDQSTNEVIKPTNLVPYHEEVGHASGQINDGVGDPKETLKNYKST